jgi:hypothetical protein
MSSFYKIWGKNNPFLCVRRCCDAQFCGLSARNSVHILFSFLEVLHADGWSTRYVAFYTYAVIIFKSKYSERWTMVCVVGAELPRSLLRNWFYCSRCSNIMWHCVLAENAVRVILPFNVISYIAFKDRISGTSGRKWGHSFTFSWVINSLVEAVRWPLAPLVHVILDSKTILSLSSLYYAYTLFITKLICLSYAMPFQVDEAISYFTTVYQLHSLFRIEGKNLLRNCPGIMLRYLRGWAEENNESSECGSRFSCWLSNWPSPK